MQTNFFKTALGYPTQKPEALLERILNASSSEGDIVLDPFCGCGTTVAVAQRLNRRWIGIDITHLAINLIKSRLRDIAGDAVTKTYSVTGEPVSLASARELAESEPFQFQSWALGLVEARTAAKAKKGADKGIDGRLYFYDDTSGNAKQIIFSVKGGRNISVEDIQKLDSVVRRENAQIGVLITLHPPGQPMRREAASGGFYELPTLGGMGDASRRKYPRIQILTIDDLLNGKKVDRPSTNVTFKKAPRAAIGEALALPFGAD